MTLKPYVFLIILKIPRRWLNNFNCSEFKYDTNDESGLVKELVLQVRKVIGPFAAPKKIYIVSDLPKTRSGKASFIVIALLGDEPLLTVGYISNRL